MKRKLPIRDQAATFATSQLKRMRQSKEVWQVDFRALPKSITQTVTHYVGMVVSQPDARLVAESKVAQTPTANDLSALVANAIERPLVGKPHRPARILLRRNPKWTPIISALNEIGIKVESANDLPFVAKAFNDIVSQAEKVRSARKLKPSARQAAVEEIFPSIAKWVQGYGHIEFGDQESFGFTVRALDYGGIVFEDDKPSTLAEAMAALEARLAKWFEEEGVSCLS
jgi:hypothetical protein